MVYCIPSPDDPSPSTHEDYDISKLRLYFSKILAEDEFVSVCKAYRVGPMRRVCCSWSEDTSVNCQRQRLPRSTVP